MLTLKRLGIISLILLCVIVCSFTVIEVYDSKKVSEINATKDMRLVNYEYSKSIAVNATNILTINDQQSYNSAKEHLYSVFSSDLRDEYFPTDKRESIGIKLNKNITSVTGEIKGENSFIFKVRGVLSTEGKSFPLTMLIYVENGIVYKIENLV